MVSTGAVVGIALVAFGLALTPGPNMLYLVSRSITQGRAAGMVSLLGVSPSAFSPTSPPQSPESRRSSSPCPRRIPR